MVLREQLVSLNEFETYLQNHHEGLYELIHGEIVEKVPTEAHGTIVLNIGSEIRAYLKQNPIGRVTTEARHRAAGDVYNERLPDVSFRRTHDDAVTKGAIEQMPDLAVEVKSPDDTYKQMREKADYYLANGTSLVWLVFPEKQIVEVYQLGQPLQTYGIEASLSGGDVLPDFHLKVSEIFVT